VKFLHLSDPFSPSDHILSLTLFRHIDTFLNIRQHMSPTSTICRLTAYFCWNCSITPILPYYILLFCCFHLFPTSAFHLQTEYHVSYFRLTQKFQFLLQFLCEELFSYQTTTLFIMCKSNSHTCIGAIISMMLPHKFF
jgi:hypothetical protein